MRARSYAIVVACIVLVGSAAGCGRPDGGTVRRGQNGEFIAPEPGAPGEVPRLATPPLVHLKVDNEGYDLSSFRRLGLPVTPIVVTENPADEEFWEFSYRGLTATSPAAVDRPLFVIGARRNCQVMREEHEANNIRTGPCLGPHYFKRTGPPVVERRSGYNP